MLVIKRLSIYSFSVDDLGNQRVKFQHKICFRPTLTHLKLKSTPSVSLTARLMASGQFLKIYKFLLKSYLININAIVEKLPEDNEFKNFFDSKKFFCSLDESLLWKVLLVNVIFNIRILSKKKIIYYLKPERRAPLALSWLKNMIKLQKKDNHNYSINLSKPIFIFLTNDIPKNPIFNLKLKIYKLKLLRG